jgi:DNA-binding MurR/RpiR family transcriptional regulator
MIEMTEKYHYGPLEANPVFTDLRARLPDLTKSEARIARYLLHNEARIGLETGASLAAATQVSEITVSRFLRKLGFKGLRDLRHRLSTAQSDTTVPTAERFMRLLSGSDSALLKAEAQATRKLSRQIAAPEWKRMVDRLALADRVFVTGYQTVRGMAEDFARRLGIVRDAVRFVSTHEGGLVEWANPSRSLPDGRNVLVMIDILPYAREAEKTCAIARKLGFDVILFTDEFNNWAYAHTDLVFHAESKTGFFLESTASLNCLLNFANHAVAERDPEQSRARIENWLEITRDLDLF